MASDTEITPILPKNKHQQKAYLYEFKWLLKNSIPLVVSCLLQNSLQSASIMNAGHIGGRELASATLGSMFVTISGLSVATGATLSLDTLCSQSFSSSKDKTVVGLHVQRCLAFMSMLYIPIVCFWWNAEYIFILLRQDPIVAHLAAVYVRWMILAAPAFAISEALKKMLQAQGLFNAPTLVLLIGAPINVLLNYLLVWVPALSLGFHGVAIASCITYWIIVVLLILYIRYVDGHQAWPTWSFRNAFSHWQPMIRLAIPGILLICTEVWAYEIIALGASWIDTTNLGAQSVILTSITALYTLAFGIGIAGANRVGNLLGAQRHKQARRAGHVTLVIGMVASLINSLTLYLSRNTWAYLFTSDPEIARLVSQVIPWVSIFVFTDNLAGVADGVLNGMGRQHVGAWCNLGAYYFFALPVGFWLCFRKGWGLLGLWSILAVALVVSCFITLVVVLSSDWERESDLAKKRAQKERNSMDNKFPKNTQGNLPAYNTYNTTSPMQKELQAVQAQQQQSQSSYPGVVGGTPSEFKGIQGYDTQGNPIIPPFIVQRHQIEQNLGPTCKSDGGYHNLRMHLTAKSLLFAFLAIPYFCGYKGKRVVNDKKK
ncbi:mate-domain-containing protein [Sporodiniella umbellata]|nr:mate-domain-containing protein [Sporodiniella umbellata]